eukprot:scaffold1318_cov388-Prasinococcus_capsulatus_cf.AAC.73
MLHWICVRSELFLPHCTLARRVKKLLILEKALAVQRHEHRLTVEYVNNEWAMPNLNSGPLTELDQRFVATRPLFRDRDQVSLQMGG